MKRKPKSIGAREMERLRSMKTSDVAALAAHMNALRPGDKVNHPSHYKSAGIEAIDVIEAFGLGFSLGNAVKYILRAGRKGDAIEDLKKSLWYVQREIAKRETEAVARG